MALILITNDDGISSPGIEALINSFKSQGEVYVVAPETEQSAVAHALTLHRPLTFREVKKNIFYLNGTPTDCVVIGVNKLLPAKPDILVSGINNGGNLGDDITYSGTVAAAIEGTLLGIPSIAISLAVDYQNNNGHSKNISSFLRAADFGGELVATVLKRGLPANTLLNVNVPDNRKIKGVKITRQGKLAYDNSIKELSDPRGREYYWIGGGNPQSGAEENTDIEAVRNGYTSVTPVHLDLTNYEALEYIKENWDM